MKANKELRILFMGTADFARPSLEALVMNGYNVVAALTMPDKPMGRGHKIKGSAIKECTLKHNIRLLQPTNLNAPTFISELRSLDLDLGIVVAFRMLPQSVWQLPRMGTINLHGSLLPDYRGAAPIHWAVMNGDAETGVSTFLLRHETDTGDILLQARTTIDKDESVGSVYERLMHIGADLLLETVDGLARKDIAAQSQDRMPGPRRPAPKLFKEDCQIDWCRSNIDLHNFVRGLSPYPCAWCELSIDERAALSMKILQCRPIEADKRHNNLNPGAVVIGPKRSLEVVCSEGVLQIISLQVAGKKAMAASDYLRGLRSITED